MRYDFHIDHYPFVHRTDGIELLITGRPLYARHRPPRMPRAFMYLASKVVCEDTGEVLKDRSGTGENYYRFRYNVQTTALQMIDPFLPDSITFRHCEEMLLHLRQYRAVRQHYNEQDEAAARTILYGS